MFVGKRKTATARIFKSNKNLLPKHLVDFANQYEVDLSDYSYIVKGGGLFGQSEAIYYAVVKMIKELKGRSVLQNIKVADTRQKERMKPGRTKARKSQPYLRR